MNSRLPGPLTRTWRRYAGPQSGIVRMQGSFGVVDLDLGVDPDRWVYVAGALERHLHPVFQSLVRPGDIAVDIGANAGLHSLLLAGLVGEAGSVLAIEPVPHVFQRLEHNLRLNPERKVTAIRVALSDRVGVAPLFVVPAGRSEQGNHSLVQNEKIRGLLRQHVVPVEVELTTLDTVLRGAGAGVESTRISLVKIDVEGAEPSVMRGMAELIDTTAPHILIEHDPARIEAVGAEGEPLRRLLELGYRAWSIDGRGRCVAWTGATQHAGREIVFVSGRRAPTWAPPTPLRWLG